MMAMTIKISIKVKRLPEADKFIFVLFGMIKLYTIFGKVESSFRGGCG
jgi:hypothetical protein